MGIHRINSCVGLAPSGRFVCAGIVVSAWSIFFYPYISLSINFFLCLSSRLHCVFGVFRMKSPTVTHIYDVTKFPFTIAPAVPSLNPAVDGSAFETCSRAVFARRLHTKNSHMGRPVFRPKFETAGNKLIDFVEVFRSKPIGYSDQRLFEHA